jgi:putative flippase GtrA
LSVGLAALAVLLSLVEGNYAITNGLAIGSITGISFFLSTWWCINVVFRSEQEKKPNPILVVLAIKLFFLKFPLAGIALWYVFKHLPISPLAFVCGIVITQVSFVIAAVAKYFK